MNKLSLKLICAIVIATFIITGGATIVYSLLAPNMYVNQQKNDIVSAYNSIKEVKIADKKYKEIISNCEDEDFKIIITDSNFKKVYSSNKLGMTNRTIRDSKDDFNNLIAGEYDMLQFRSEVSGSTKLELHGKYIVNNEAYYIIISENLGAIDKNFDYTNKILIYILLVSLIFESVVIAILSRSISKPISTLEEVTNKFIENDYSARYNGKFTNDEIGNLAKAFNKMADKIHDNITDLNNYNFLLKEDMKMISEYDEMRKKVVRNITHDLKTPLAIISSQIEMMQICDNSKRSDYYNSAMEEIEKMSNEISDILKSSKDNEVNPLYEKINLSEEIIKLSSELSKLTDSKNLEFKTDIQKDIIIVSNKRHIRYIFNNYVHNAIKHVGESGVIKVSLSKDYNNVSTLEVYNDGKNIPDGEINKIWNNFEQGKNDETISPGNGIGLYIVKEIALMSGDNCEVVNKMGGVSFKYYFTSNAEGGK